jgi:glycosyltransferase involved in cell wall biosynthesis
VIPTGVDLDYFAYGESAALDDADGGTVVFTGSMDWMANVDGVEFFMDAVWPAIARARSRARCVIVGRRPPQAQVERTRTRRLNWEFTGFVDDVRPFVRNAQVYAIPLRVGGGTRIGVEGLPVEPDRHFLEADSADAMAAAVVSLLDDHERRKQLSHQARRFVEENMSAHRAAQAFEQICLRALPD